MATSGVTLRSLETPADVHACVELQRETWGRDFDGCVPAALLLVARKVGGVTAGAFADDGRLLGFVFGITGYVDGRPVHWSHMLAVRETARNAGLGIRLKLYQRELLLAGGVDLARWTYDPLVAKNAHVNVNRLGAVVVEYVENMYGFSNSALHTGLDTDRFVVEWRLSDERVGRVIAGHERTDPAPWIRSPVVNDARDLPAGPRVRIRIPGDIYAVRARSAAEARAWRAHTRRAFLWYLGRGYRITAFYREPGNGDCCYGLARE